VAQEVFLIAFGELRHWRVRRGSTPGFIARPRTCALNASVRRSGSGRLQDRVPEMATRRHPKAPCWKEKSSPRLTMRSRGCPPPPAVIFALRQYEDLRFNVIAELLEITEAGAKAGYHKALLTLQRWLKHLAPERAAPYEKECMSAVSCEDPSLTHAYLHYSPQRHRERREQQEERTE